MAERQPENEVCSVGLTLFNYSRMMLGASAQTDVQTLRARGVSALMEAGLMTTAGLRGMEQRFGIANSTAPPPIIVDHDYNLGLPFPGQSFDLRQVRHHRRGV